MAYTTIDDPSVYFQTLLYTGDGNDDRNLVNTGNSDLQPDWIWIKDRDNARSHEIYDSSRGATKRIQSDSTGAESTQANNLQAFQSDGFQLGSGNGVNQASQTLVAWQWKANGGSRTTFTESGNNPGGGYQANTTAGFSIVDYTGTGGAGTVSHGLGAVPHWIIIKNREISGSWIVYHHKNTSAPETDILELQANNATYDSNTYFNDTAPTSSVFTVNTSNDVNKDADGIIAYVFTEIQGYSKFGSYTGNGNADGAFVYTGFKPAWVMIKVTSGTKGWHIHDAKRQSYNADTNKLSANDNSAESTSSVFTLDLLSNGFKCRSSDNEQNGNGDSYIYMAFAEHPFVSSKGVPATAR